MLAECWFPCFRLSGQERKKRRVTHMRHFLTPTCHLNSPHAVLIQLLDEPFVVVLTPALRRQSKHQTHSWRQHVLYTISPEPSAAPPNWNHSWRQPRCSTLVLTSKLLCHKRHLHNLLLREATLMIFLALPVPLSFAPTYKMPLESISKVTSTCGVKKSGSRQRDR